MALQDLTPQLRTRLGRIERVVGLFVSLATLLLLAGFAYYVYHTAQRKGWLVTKVPYYTMIDSATGILNTGSPVSSQVARRSASGSLLSTASPASSSPKL